MKINIFLSVFFIIFVIMISECRIERPNVQNINPFLPNYYYPLDESILRFLVLNVHKALHGPWREKTCLWGFANNTGSDQPVHPLSLTSAFVIHKVLLASIIPRLDLSKISVAEQAGLSLALSETLKTGFNILIIDY